MTSTPTPEVVRAALAAAGSSVTPAELELEPREERVLARLPGDQLIWFAVSEAGRRRLATERRVLHLLEKRCAFAAPRVLHEDPGGAFDLRAGVAGEVNPRLVYERARQDRPFAERLGAEIGGILGDQHTAIRADDCRSWLANEPSWPEPSSWIVERLPDVTDDAELVGRAHAALAEYEDVTRTVGEEDRVLVHGDVGFHNLAVSDTQAVCGIFDYDGAAWADRHHDFRYLLFDEDRTDLLEAAAGVYESLTRRTLSRRRIALYNAVCALSYLAYRRGTPAEARSCGRTLAEDLAWTTLALARVQ